MRDRFRRWAIALADSAHDHPRRFIVVALLVTAIAVWGTTHLKIDQDLKAFLPRDAKSIQRLERLRDRIGAQTDLLVAVESADRKANIAFGQVLARRLAKLKELRWVIFDRDIAFFERNALLYLPVDELLDLRKEVITRVRREVAKKTIVDLEDEDNDADKKDTFVFDPKERVAKVFGGAEQPSRYVQNKDGTLLIIRARPIKQTTDVGFTHQLVSKVQRLIVEANPKKYHATMEARVRGEYAERVAESSSIFGQIMISAMVATALLLAMIGGYFRSIRAIPIVLIPVIAAALATFGAGALLYGSFNMATAFIFAILLGLGVDFTIHALARYQFERLRGGRMTRNALRLSISSTGAAVAAGALTSIAVFWLLQLGRFRGFSQFGAMAGIGVLLALIAAFTLVPALVSAFERCLPSRLSRPQSHPRASVRRNSGAPRRSLAVILVFVSLGSAGWALMHATDVDFEYDFNKLGRKKDPRSRPGEDGADYRSATGQAVSYAPAVAMCRDGAQCERTTRLLMAIRRLDDAELSQLRAFRTRAATGGTPRVLAQKTGEKTMGGGDDEEIDDGPFTKLRAELAGGKLSPAQRALLLPFDTALLAYMHRYLRGFLSLQAFVPDRQTDKLRIIADIKAQVDRRRDLITGSARTQIDRWYRYLEIDGPIDAESLPRWVLTQFMERGGARGRFVVIWNGGSKRDYRHTKQLHDVYFDLKLGPNETVPLAANYFVLAEAIDTLKADGPVVMTAAAVAVFVALLVLFRSARGALLVAIPLVVSISWLLEVYYLYEVKLNIFSMVALPLLIGMTVDNGIHVYHRYLETRDVRVVLREVGGPVALTTATTLVGFSSLLIADHVGIQTLGFTAALGMLLGLVGSTVALPALLVALGPWGLPRSRREA